jgi:hypothetical protein
MRVCVHARRKISLPNRCHHADGVRGLVHACVSVYTHTSILSGHCRSARRKAAGIDGVDCCPRLFAVDLVLEDAHLVVVLAQTAETAKVRNEARLARVLLDSAAQLDGTAHGEARVDAGAARPEAATTIALESEQTTVGRAVGTLGTAADEEAVCGLVHAATQALLIGASRLVGNGGH